MAEIESESETNSKFIHPNSSNQIFYANGFVGGDSSVDMYIIGMLNGMPNFTINMSYPTARLLQNLMNNVFAIPEAKNPTTDEISNEQNESGEKEIANG